MSAVPQMWQKEPIMLRKRVALFTLVVAGFTVHPVRAQEQQTEDPHAGHRMMSPPAQPENPDGDANGKEDDSSGVNGAAAMDMSAMNMGSMQGGSPPPDARDPHAYAEGYDFGPMKLRLADTHRLGALLVENLEMMRSDDNTFAEYDFQAWYGRTYDRVVLKAEGNVDDSKFEEARTELLWGHAIAAYWDAQLGVRYDNDEKPDRTWLTFGVQGLAPYWFEVDAAAYVGEEGRSALRLDVQYELLLTQRVILQPKIETNFYGKSDAARGLGRGLSEASVALRLRYEIRREFAPYMGVEWVRTFGDTADLARAAGEDASETRFIAGLRFWF
jgi:copper resistance protein B